MKRLLLTTNCHLSIQVSLFHRCQQQVKIHSNHRRCRPIYRIPLIWNRNHKVLMYLMTNFKHPVVSFCFFILLSLLSFRIYFVLSFLPWFLFLMDYFFVHNAWSRAYRRFCDIIVSIELLLYHTIQSCDIIEFINYRVVSCDAHFFELNIECRYYSSSESMGVSLNFIQFKSRRQITRIWMLLKIMENYVNISCWQLNV